MNIFFTCPYSKYKYAHDVNILLHSFRRDFNYYPVSLRNVRLKKQSCSLYIRVYIQHRRPWDGLSRVDAVICKRNHFSTRYFKEMCSTSYFKVCQSELALKIIVFWTSYSIEKLWCFYFLFGIIAVLGLLLPRLLR